LFLQQQAEAGGKRKVGLRLLFIVGPVRPDAAGNLFLSSFCLGGEKKKDDLLMLNAAGLTLNDLLPEKKKEEGKPRSSLCRSD